MFEVGDVVECIDDGKSGTYNYSLSLTKGKLYEVLEVHNSEYDPSLQVRIKIINDTGEGKFYWPQRFKLKDHEDQLKTSNEYKKTCIHKWKVTLGLMRTYYDCELCGIKQEEA